MNGCTPLITFARLLIINRHNIHSLTQRGSLAGSQTATHTTLFAMDETITQSYGDKQPTASMSPGYYPPPMHRLAAWCCYVLRFYTSPGGDATAAAIRPGAASITSPPSTTTNVYYYDFTRRAKGKSMTNIGNPLQRGVSVSSII